MGLSIAGILSEIFIIHLEHEYILNTNKQKYAYIAYWYWYVDDILFVHKGNK
jgi:hypothetical protein